MPKHCTSYCNSAVRESFGEKENVLHSGVPPAFHGPPAIANHALPAGVCAFFRRGPLHPPQAMRDLHRGTGVRTGAVVQPRN